MNDQEQGVRLALACGVVMAVSGVGSPQLEEAHGR
jgi:hypothetical protein